eukprot:TRINITY_DN21071_c0_g1_i1.p1 TRINITY_DN21071_c0_g1~~TRINITY_DN21071_c0_g1_i1.p1  ORF type:complete len:256 (-),score=58.08 TRINITY_DN21071_c0_g1_i1:170-889(-)
MRSYLIFYVLLYSTLESYSNAEFIEGDIAYRKEDKKSSDGTQSAFLWHHSTNWVYGRVPYYIDEDSITDEDHRNLIKTVIEDIEDAAKCISFKDLAGKEKIGDYIRIRTHELLHSLGQLHEQTRPDRDENVEIIHANIEPNQAHNFKKRDKGPGKNQVVHMDASYDMYSLLHYPSTAWSKDNKSETIRPINKQYKTIGGTDGMTATDIIELNLRYGCSDIGTPYIVDYIHEVEHRADME